MIDWEAYFEALKIPFVLLACTIVFTALFCIFLNWGTAQKEKEHIHKKEEIKQSLMPNWSLRNAMIINRETCNYTSGDVRLGMGLYRTPEESDKYIEDSLKQSLP